MAGKVGTASPGGSTASAAAGGKGANSLGGAGAGRGKGEGSEDTEHKSKVLLSAGDPDNVFGDGLPKTTPPVIGI
ncbi:hypothetical protein [Amycolatopsis sp.]|uniref:hypothetical protein n=1 Tax=Amycolatopsis sp. TaxID=37632 RepID=UPI00262F5A6F|nr:hypothetical protein [Amycolatopsis sp.]